MKKEKFFLREKISSDFQGKSLGLNAKEGDKAKCYLNKDGKIQFEPCKKKYKHFLKILLQINYQHSWKNRDYIQKIQ